MAGSAVTMKVTGIPGLRDALAQLSRATGRAALERAGLEAAEPTARLMRALAPKDTGELSESIEVGTTATNFDDAGKAYQRVRAAGGTVADAVAAMRDVRRAERGLRGETYATVFIGPVAGRSRDDVIKGFVQEFGTATREPQSFLRAGFEQDKAALYQRLSKEIQLEVFAALARSRARRGA